MNLLSHIKSSEITELWGQNITYKPHVITENFMVQQILRSSHFLVSLCLSLQNQTMKWKSLAFTFPPFFRAYILTYSGKKVLHSRRDWKSLHKVAKFLSFFGLFSFATLLRDGAFRKFRVFIFLNILFWKILSKQHLKEV